MTNLADIFPYSNNKILRREAGEDPAVRSLPIASVMSAIAVREELADQIGMMRGRDPSPELEGAYRISSQWVGALREITGLSGK